MDWFTEALIASEGMHGYLLGLGDGEYDALSTGAAPSPYRPAPKIGPYVNVRQLVKQVAQPAGYTPAAITPGLQAALRARQALQSRTMKAPTPARRDAEIRAHQSALKQMAQNIASGATRAASDAGSYVKQEIAKRFDVPADSNLVATAASPDAVLESQQRERLLREKLASNAYEVIAPAARQDAIQKDMARVIAEAEYQRSAQPADQAAVEPQNLEYGPRVATAEEMFRASKALKSEPRRTGLKELLKAANAASDIKAKASAWASSFFGGGK